MNAFLIVMVIHSFSSKVIVYPGERFPLRVVAYNEYNKYDGIAVTLSDSQVIIDLELLL